jgi:SEC-C motif
MHPHDVDGNLVMLELSEDVAAGQVLFLCLEGDWVVGISFGAAVWPVLDVMRAMDGVALYDPPPLPGLDEQAGLALRVLDRLHGDQTARDRATALLTPDPGDRSLGSAGNDPCWCGSGKKLKRCHAASRRP